MYTSSPAQTQKTIASAVTAAIVAYADNDGDLFLVDRIRELILVSGFNVYPREVEDVIADHPEVAEVAVIGVPHPYTGEAVRALVVPEPGSEMTPDDVIEYAAFGRGLRTIRLVEAQLHAGNIGDRSIVPRVRLGAENFAVPRLAL